MDFSDNGKVNLHEGHRNRMYEKLLKSKDSLPDHELLEMLLFIFLPRVNTNEIAHRLLLRFGSIENVLRAKEAELTLIEGVGKKTAAGIKLFGELEKRIGKNKEVKPPKRFSFATVKQYLEDKLGGLDTEKMIALFISDKNEITAIREYEQGDKRKVQVNLVELSKEISVSEPYAVIIAHNHPSGIPYPSIDDDDSVKQIALMMNYTGSRFLDNIIVGGKGNYYSYKQEGRMDAIVKKSSPVKFLDYMKSLE